MSLILLGNIHNLVGEYQRSYEFLLKAKANLDRLSISEKREAANELAELEYAFGEYFDCTGVPKQALESF